MIEMTDKQRLVVEMLAKAARRREAAPTFREMAARLGVDVRSAYQHVEALERKGVVRRLGGRRGIELSPEHAPEPGVPVVGRVAAGMPILAEQNIDGYIDLSAEVDADESVFLLKVKGDSMVDRSIFDGDMVLVRPADRLSPGELGVVAVDGEATVKEVHVSRDRVTLRSRNAAKGYPDQVYGPERDIRVVGRVVMAIRYIDRDRPAGAGAGPGGTAGVAGAKPAAKPARQTYPGGSLK